MTTPPTLSARPTCGVVWQELRTVPPHGLNRPPAKAEPAYLANLRKTWELPGRSLETPAAVRARIRETCRLWRMRTLAPVLELIASELATNAVQHAPGEHLRVTLWNDGYRAWVAVTDQGPTMPILPRIADEDDECGRGLALVAALSLRWSAVHDEDGNGTTVWACLQLPQVSRPDDD